MKIKTDDVVTEEANSNTEEGLTQLATNYIAAVGGTDNLKAIDACITRLRLTVGDSAKVNDAACKRLGASGVVKLNKQTIRVIVGAKAESVGDAMKKVVARGPVAAAAASTDSAPAAAPAAKTAGGRERQKPSKRWFPRSPVKWWRLSRYRMKPSPAKPLVTVSR